MDIEKAKELASELKDHHKLDDWDIEFRNNEVINNRGTVVASTHHPHKHFSFSSAYFSVNDKTFCKDQILHEIAHALLPYGANHGELWRKKCVEIGAIPFQLCEREYPYRIKRPEGRRLPWSF